MARFTSNISDVDIRLLRVFVAVAENGGVTPASQVLGLDPSTISRQLSELETRLGLKLCSRGRAGFWLTDEGRTVLIRAEELMGALNIFRRRIGDIHKDLEGEIVLACADTALWCDSYKVPEAIHALMSEAPNITVSSRVRDLAEMEREVIDHRAQIGIMPIQGCHSSLYTIPLFKENTSLFVGRNHPLFLAPSVQITIEEIQKYPVVWMLVEAGMSKKITELDLTRGPSANTSEAIAGLIQSGHYLGFLPTDYGQVFCQQGKMRSINMPETEYSVEIGAVVLDSQRSMSLTDLFLTKLIDAHQHNPK